MNWEAVGAIAESLGAIGVIAYHALRNEHDRQANPGNLAIQALKL